MAPGQVVLVYGDNPFARRVTFYLEGYGKQRNMNVVAIPLKESPAYIDDVMAATFELYTWDDGEQTPTAIVNCHVDYSLAPEIAFRENSLGAAHLALAARAANIPLIQMSSPLVFSGTKSGPYDTDRDPDPVMVPGLSLYQAERAVMSIHPAHEGGPIGACVIRVGAMYGFDVDSWPREYRPGVSLSIPSGPGTISPVFISEAAFLVARNLLESPNLLRRGLVHMAPGGGVSISWLDFLNQQGVTAVPAKSNTTMWGEDANQSLMPTKGWNLPKDLKRSWDQFMQERLNGEYTTYW